MPENPEAAPELEDLPAAESAVNVPPSGGALPDDVEENSPPDQPTSDEVNE